MTTWDKIYKEYKKSGKKWATLDEDIHPLFKKFLQKTDFRIMYVLDIGCGTGKYLKFLHSLKFKTDGIDSSKTAIQITKKGLPIDSKINCTKMFEFKIPKDRYDLIISISTIHHGTKVQIQNLICRLNLQTLSGDG